MREIKFRAWNTLDGKWLSDSKTINMALDWANIGLEVQPGGKFSISHDGLVLMQYTGLEDKNGLEVYEGDILRWPNYHGDPKPCKNCGHVEHDKDLICQVVYKNGAPHHDGNEWADDRLAQFEGDDVLEVEVIGNIYENPELLK